MFNFSLTRSSRWFLAELLPSWSAPRPYNKWSYSSPCTGLCTSLCWISWDSCQSFTPNFQVITCASTVNAPSDHTKAQPNPLPSRLDKFLLQQGLSRGAEQENELFVCSFRKRDPLALLKYLTLFLELIGYAPLTSSLSIVSETWAQDFLQRGMHPGSKHSLGVPVYVPEVFPLSFVIQLVRLCTECLRTWLCFRSKPFC